MTSTMPRIIDSDRDLRLVEQVIRDAPLPYRLMFTILRETGMRASEVCQLQVRDVVLEPGREMLWVRAGKTGDRVVTLTSNTHARTLRGLRAYLKQIGKRPPASALFLSNRKTQVSYDALEYQWQHALKQVGLIDEQGKGRYTLHQLRHTRATELLDAGLRIEHVQRVLGHKSIKSTQVYAQISDTVLREQLMDVRLPRTRGRTDEHDNYY
jgi:site-specific recombinase XerD